MKSTEISYREIFGIIQGEEGFTSNQIVKPKIFQPEGCEFQYSYKYKFI